MTEHDERRLPVWAQDRLSQLRATVQQLTLAAYRRGDDGAARVGVARAHRDEATLAVQRTRLPLDDADEVVFSVTGGELHVRLWKFGSRYSIEIVGMADYDPLLRDRAEVAVMPAMGNVVRVGFVMPVPDTVRVNPLVLKATPAIDRSTDRRPHA